MNSSKTTVMVSKIIEKVQLILGVLITFFFGIISIMVVFDDQDDSNAVVIIIWMIAACGIALIVFSRKRRKLIKNFEAYVRRLSVDPTGSIENLATGLGTSQDLVMKNLQEMINKKYFVNAYIDEANHRVVFPAASSESDGIGIQPMMNNEAIQNVEYNTVTCKNCGGINKVAIGKVQECDFCGSPIK